SRRGLPLSRHLRVIQGRCPWRRGGYRVGENFGYPSRASTTAGDGGQDRDGVLRIDLGLERAEVTHILVVHVHVHEPMKRAIVGQDHLRDPRVPGLAVLEQLAQRRTLRVNRAFTTGVRSQDRRTFHTSHAERPSILAPQLVATPCSASGGAWPGVSPQNAS